MADSFATRRLDVGDHQVPVGESGSGEVLWYFHDEASAAPGPVAEELAEHFRVISAVHPGFGDAGRPDWVERAEDVADVYVDVIDAVTPDAPLILVGASVGGWIAAEVALLLSDRVTQLVLVGPLGLHVPEEPPADHWFMRDEERERTLFANPAAKPELSIDEFIANEGMIARLGWNPRLASKRLAPRLHRLSARTLVLWGAQDALVPPSYADRWADLLPDAASARIAECGHYPVHERPQDVAGEVTRFLMADREPAQGARR